jgi:glutamine synthetase
VSALCPLSRLMTSRPIPGTVTREQLVDAVSRGHIDTVLTVIPDLYGRLVGKRITGRYFLEHVAGHGTHVCNYLVACDMEMDPVPGYRFTSWESGYGDMTAVPDLSTLRTAAWLERSAIVLCDLQQGEPAAPVEVAPRQMLRRQLERAREAGLAVFGGSEIELYAFDETYESALAKRYAGLKTLGPYIEDYHILQGTKGEPLLGAIRRGLDASGIPVESTKGEWGPGQQEINLEYSEALEQADRNVLYKHAVKEIALLQGKAVTFMAKWDENLAGSSMHVHLSLRPAAGGELPGADRPLGPLRAAEPFRWFLGGMIAHARELAAFFAPNVSSYKRYQAGTFAPVNIAWSPDNRTAGFRVLGSGPSIRVECRIPGADANPYLVYAALIAAGLEGFHRKTEPPPPVAGDVYQAEGLSRVPGALREAIEVLEGSEVARQVFGGEVVEHYLHFFRTEQRKFDAVVTDWEKARYFERI